MQHYSTVGALSDFARSMKGQTFETLARGRKFTVDVIGATLRNMPGKSHDERPEPQKTLTCFLAQLE
jgi:hypothetical protein